MGRYEFAYYADEECKLYMESYDALDRLDEFDDDGEELIAVSFSGEGFAKFYRECLASVDKRGGRFTFIDTFTGEEKMGRL